MRERCPNCGSNDLALTNGSYSVGCGCLGLLLFGWIGLLLGLLGMGDYKLVCKHCGSSWPAGRPQLARSGGCGCLLFLFIILIIITAAAGCRVHTANLTGNWELKSGSTAEAVTLSINKDGSFYGFGGVNRYFGKLALPYSDGRFVLQGTPGVTRMFGPDLDKEQAYLQKLINADHWQINGDNELELYSKNKKTAVFIYKSESKNK